MPGCCCERGGGSSATQHVEAGAPKLNNPQKPLNPTPQATKNLEKAKKVWDGDEAELAQVHNALGFCYYQMSKVGRAPRRHIL